jgi:hypothetical protein
MPATEIKGDIGFNPQKLLSKYTLIASTCQPPDPSRCHSTPYLYPFTPCLLLVCFIRVFYIITWPSSRPAPCPPHGQRPCSVAFKTSLGITLTHLCVNPVFWGSTTPFPLELLQAIHLPAQQLQAQVEPGYGV